MISYGENCRLKRAACHYAYERDPNHHLQLPGVKETESPMEMGRSRTASTSEFHPIERTDNVVRRSMSSSVLSFKRHSNCGQQPEMNIKEPETPPPITEWILYASLQQKYNK